MATSTIAPLDPGTTSAPRHAVGGIPSSAGPASRRGAVALTCLRLVLGVEFLWAFLDKTFGLGYSTPHARAWISGGSPTKGFLAGVKVGPLQSFFHSIAGTPAANWLSMVGLAGIGTALILGVALRIAAASGVLLLALMYLASWPLAKLAGGKPTSSTNPIVDSHMISAFALIVIGVFAVQSAGLIGRRWAALDLVHRFPWLR